ncbi:MotA/TolQ/ExbB proton channel family protein [Marinobacter sp. JSM 1782161]|uniref:MotA/TolQ/ExbB proton channel family protein n=1 Tax=Marinobacter sp. JSM 1782161 TaxID=2685906 RepID=UPI0014029F84|nr:MotA/TolQ/ExbB proton channel family protein [Marinobacter sp. JSM 1782161]
MKTLSRILICACLLGAGSTALAQEDALSLDGLLDSIQQASREDSRLNQQRLARFRAEQSDQAAQLEALRAELQQARARSESLEQAFEDNATDLQSQRAELKRTLGDLQELFGVLGQAASQARARFQDSPSQVQFPERTDFLATFSQQLENTNRLPALADIRRLWFEIQRGIVESGRVVRFEAPVVGLDGTTEDRTVVRAGPFNVFADGHYIQYSPATGQLNALARQPGSGYATLAADARPEGEPVVAALDPARGQLLDMLLQSPSVTERIGQGGVVGYIILGLGALALLVALERLLVLGVMGAKVARQARHPTAPGNNPLGRILQAAQRYRHRSPEVLETAMGEAMLRERPLIQRGLGFIRIIAAVAPLLGLLGTVVGMILTFQSITLFGNSDPKMMAGGISQALVTTVLGLAVAIPVLLLHTLVAARSRSVWQVLEEQAAGLIAEQLLPAADAVPTGPARRPHPATEPLEG